MFSTRCMKQREGGKPKQWTNNITSRTALNLGDAVMTFSAEQLDVFTWFGGSWRMRTKVIKDSDQMPERDLIMPQHLKLLITDWTACPVIQRLNCTQHRHVVNISSRPNIRPHHSTSCCYRPSSDVCPSVCHSSKPCKMVEPIEMPFGLWARMGPRYYVRWGPDSLMGRGNFERERGNATHCKV